MSYTTEIAKAWHRLRLEAVKAATGEGEAESEVVVKRHAGLGDEGFDSHMADLAKVPAIGRKGRVRAAVGEFLDGLYGLGGGQEGD